MSSDMNRRGFFGWLCGAAATGALPEEKKKEVPASLMVSGPSNPFSGLVASGYQQLDLGYFCVSGSVVIPFRPYG